MSPTVGPPAGLCPQCGREPGKPKFCCRSCAAAFNNHRKPKRGPEGKCADCGVAILTKMKRCQACAASAAEIKRREAENIQSFRTPVGTIREYPVQKAWVHGEMVFEPHLPNGRRFTLTDPCGDFLDALLGVVFARPAYIRTDDIYRYAAWIDAFRSHVIERYFDTATVARQQPVTTLPLRRLEYALRAWVDDVVCADNHALFPTLALDTAGFIEGHAHGHHDYGRDAWRVARMVESSTADAYTGRDRLAEPRLKHEVTGRIKGTLVRSTVPAGSGFPVQPDTPPLPGPGDAFVFEIDRCHLTKENYYDRPCVRAVEGDPPRFDVAADLWFRGAILLDPNSRVITCLASQTDSTWRWNSHAVQAEIPVRWITDVYELSGGGRTYQPDPVPRWAV